MRVILPSGSALTPLGAPGVSLKAGPRTQSCPPVQCLRFDSTQSACRETAATRLS
jgi:hypothetical protein